MKYFDNYIRKMEQCSIAEIRAQKNALVGIDSMTREQRTDLIMALHRLEEYKSRGPKSTAEAFEEILKGGGVWNGTDGL